MQLIVNKLFPQKSGSFFYHLCIDEYNDHGDGNHVDLKETSSNVVNVIK